MLRHELFWVQMAILTLVAVADTVAVHWYLYWKFPWIDMPMHFAGGLWVGLLILWVFFYSPFLETPKQPMRMLAFAIIGALFIGIGWECMELVIHVPIQGSYPIDTATDLMMDVLGSIAAWGFVRQRYE